MADLNRHRAIFADLLREMAATGITLRTLSDLDAAERAWLDGFFRDNIFPALTPIALDPAHPFPFVLNGGLAMALRLSDAQVPDMRAVLPLPT